MNDAALPYASYLLRLWITPASEPADDSGWQGEVEHIQTGARLRFSNPDALWAFLNQNHRSGEQHAAPNSND